MLRGDPAYAERAARVSGLAKDIAEYLAGAAAQGRAKAHRLSPSLIIPPARCSTDSALTRQPKELLAKLGFVVKDIPEGHLCCGSAGTYNILQPDIARRLRERKVGTIERLRPDVIAAGNIGCITQIAAGTGLPVVHTVELIDWATGGLVRRRCGSIGRARQCALLRRQAERGSAGAVSHAVSRRGPLGFCIGSKDAEVDHGEEVKNEEEICEKEEGRSGQEEENTEVESEEDHERRKRSRKPLAKRQGCTARSRRRMVAPAPAPPMPAPAWAPPVSSGFGGGGTGGGS